jgi:hypothetical protein
MSGYMQVYPNFVAAIPEAYVCLHTGNPETYVLFYRIICSCIFIVYTKPMRLATCSYTLSSAYVVKYSYTGSPRTWSYTL